MLSLGKVVLYVTGVEDPEIIKLYYEKCVAGLEAANKRSNYISQIILIIILLNFVAGKFIEFKIAGVKLDIKIITVITPTVLSFLLFEWLMIAKRRRDLIIATQQISYKLFKIEPQDDERFFPNFNPNTLNVVPYSFMSEILSIDSKNTFRLKLIRITIVSIPLPLVIVIVFAFIKSFKIYNLQLCYNPPSNFQDLQDEVLLYGCVISSIIFIVWSLFYYYTEFSNLKLLKEAASQLQSE